MSDSLTRYNSSEKVVIKKKRRLELIVGGVVLGGLLTVGFVKGCSYVSKKAAQYMYSLERSICGYK